MTTSKHTTYCENAAKVFKRLESWSRAARDTVVPETKLEVEVEIAAYITWLRENNRESNAKAMQEWVEIMESKSVAAATRTITSLQSLMIKEGPRHPAYRLEIKHKAIKVDTQAATAEQFEFMLPIVASYHGKPDRDYRLMMYLMWYAGMAMVDACQLRWRNVNLSGQYLTGERSKTNSKYLIPVLEAEPLLALLAEYHAEAGPTVGPDSHLSDRLNTRYLTQRPWLSARIGRAAKLAGLSCGNAAHSLRRGFITRLIASGVSDTMLSQMTGHTNTASLRQYHKPTVGELRKVLQSAHDNAPSSGQSVPEGMQAASPPIPRYKTAAHHSERNSSGRWAHKAPGGSPQPAGQLG